MTILIPRVLLALSQVICLPCTSSNISLNEPKISRGTLTNNWLICLD